MERTENELIEEISQLSSEFGEKMHQLVFQRPLKADNIPLSQMKLLAVMSKKDSFKMKDITKELSIASSSATELIDKVIKEKLVERFRDPEDRRVVRVKLTEKGKDFIGECKQRKRKFWIELMKEFKREEQIELLKYSKKFYNIVCKMADEGLYF